jgi:hypothetical protein
MSIMKSLAKISLAVFFVGMFFALASCESENVNPQDDPQVNVANSSDTCKTTNR